MHVKYTVRYANQIRNNEHKQQKMQILKQSHWLTCTSCKKGRLMKFSINLFNEPMKIICMNT